MYNKTFITFLNIVIYLPIKNYQNSVLFLCLQSGFTFLPLNTVKLISKETCENHLSQFFARKSQKFSDEILPQKWQKVVEQNGTFWFNTFHLNMKKNLFHF